MGIFVGLIACADEPGLVHKITGALFRARLNVTENQEYVDHIKNRFFMRTQFEGAVDVVALTKELNSVLPSASFCQVRELRKRRLVVLASKELHCVGDILVRYATGELGADIQMVVSQFENCRDLVQRFGIPFKCVPFANDRDDHEKKLLAVIEPLNPDYLILARYMRIFSREFIAHFPERIVNIHHSFLPAFIGKNPYEQAYERGVKIVGATAHFVIEELDQGPIIFQDVINVDHTCGPETMARKGQDVEKIALARGLSLVLEDRIVIDGNRTVVFD